MSLSVQIPGFEKQRIEYKQGLFSNTLLIDGKPACKDGSSKTEYRVVDDQGSEQRFTLDGPALDLPTVVCNGETYYFAPPVSTARKIFAAVLLVPLLSGGALGGGLGGAGFMLGLRAYRSNKPAWVQHSTVIGVALGAWLTYFILLGGIRSMMGG